MTQDQHNGVTILTVAGNLSGAEAAAVRHALQASDFATDESVGTRGLVLDLDRCQFIDSDGLETLLLALKKAEARSIPAKLVLHDSNCRLILQLTRLDHRFDCCDDLPSALKMMN